MAGILSIFGVIPEHFPEFASMAILELHQRMDASADGKDIDNYYVRVNHGVKLIILMSILVVL